MLIVCITSDSEVLVKFCHGLLKIIANVRTIYSAYKTYTKVQLGNRKPLFNGLATSVNGNVEIEISTVKRWEKPNKEFLILTLKSYGGP